MKAPDKIYVRKYRDGDTSWFWENEPYEDEIAGIEAVEYIRKDALLEWAENWKQLGQSDDFMYAIETLVQHLNSM